MAGISSYAQSSREIIERYAPMVYRIALNRTRTPADAEDVMQEVFLRYIRRERFSRVRSISKPTSSARRSTAVKACSPPRTGGIRPRCRRTRAKQTASWRRCANARRSQRPCARSRPSCATSCISTTTSAARWRETAKLLGRPRNRPSKPPCTARGCSSKKR